MQAVYRLYTKPEVNPSIETIRVLAGVFGVDPDYFVRADALRERHERLDQAYAQLEADPHIAFVSQRMGRMSEADKALLVEFVRRLSDETDTPITRGSRPTASATLTVIRACGIESHIAGGHAVSLPSPSRPLLSRRSMSSSE